MKNYRLRMITAIFILFSLPVILFSEGSANKIVYLEIDNENSGDESLFAGLVLEDKVEAPLKQFKMAPQSAPAKEITLSPSLRGYITRYEREIISDNNTPSE